MLITLLLLYYAHAAVDSVSLVIGHELFCQALALFYEEYEVFASELGLLGVTSTDLTRLIPVIIHSRLL